MEQTVTAPSPNDSRDYLAEAHAILKGETLLMPTREHLLVLQQAINETALLSGLLNRVVCGLLIDSDRSEVCIPAGLVSEVERRRLDLALTKKNGHIIATLIAPHRGPTN